MPVALAEEGVAIAYRTCGTGRRNLVFLHPWGGSGSYFDETVQSLDLSAVRAITLDLRGHGDSDKPDVALTLDLVARDVFAVADDAGAAAFVAIGHSMGGKLAQYLPLVDQSRVEGLVLVESAPASALATPAFVAEWVTLAEDRAAIVEQAVRPYISRPVPESVLQRFGENWAKIPRTYLERSLTLVESSFTGRLGRVRLPTLVVAGARDPNHSAMVDEIMASFPDAHLEILDCGAEIPMEMPDELARQIGAFVASLPD